MSAMKEITWVGRGGQGAFTASRVLGAAAMFAGYQSLAFPSFGPERRGAPIRAFTRISDSTITDRSIPQKSDYIIVLDDSLYDISLAKGLKEGGCIFVNTAKDIPRPDGIRIISGDISKYASEILGKPIVNIGIIGLLLKEFSGIDIKNVYSSVEEYMPAKTVEKNKILLEQVYWKESVFDNETEKESDK